MDFFAPSWPIIVTTVVGATLLSSKLMKKLSSSRKENQNNGAKLPPTATSFLPFVGKAIEMGIDIKGFVSTYCSKLGSSIFRATIAGNSCYFLGNSKDITWIFHSNKLEFKYLHVDFLANAAGMDRKTALRLYDHPNLLPNLVKGTNRFIFNTEALQETIHTAQVTIDKFLDDYEGISNYQYTAVNLLDLVREIIFMASVTPFVSPEMATKENLELFQEFDNGVPMAVAGVPIWCMPKFRDVRAKLLGKLLAMQTESKLLASRRQAFKEAGFNDRANASSNLSIFWAVNGNSIPMVSIKIVEQTCIQCDCTDAPLFGCTLVYERCSGGWRMSCRIARPTPPFKKKSRNINHHWHWMIWIKCQYWRPSFGKRVDSRLEDLIPAT